MATTPLIPPKDTAQLQELAQKLQAWRSTRPKGQRIPEELWNAAAELARDHGLSSTATALKLSYYALQRRVGVMGRRRRHRNGAAPFVELTPPVWPDGSSQSGTVELTQACGARLTVRVPNARPKDLVPLVHLFLRHRS